MLNNIRIIKPKTFKATTRFGPQDLNTSSKLFISLSKVFKFTKNQNVCIANMLMGITTIMVTSQ